MRGRYPVGVYKSNNRFGACCQVDKKSYSLGLSDTVEGAFESYKIFKEQVIKNMADEYKDKIPEKLYIALYNYKVEITD